MDEQRDGTTSAARQGLRFYARCAGEAWRRSWDARNAILPVVGLLVLYGGARLAGLDTSFSVPGAYGAAIGTGLFVALAWVAVFLVQLVLAPPRLHARLEAELLALAARRRAVPGVRPAMLPAPAPLSGPGGPRSDEHQPPAPVREAAVVGVAPRVTATPPPMTGEGLVVAPSPIVVREREPRPARPVEALHVRLVDQVHETAVDTTGAPLPASRAYVARVANRGARRVRRCQIFFCNPTHIQVVSGPFDLGPGEHRDLPVLRVIDAGDEPHALLYFLDGETWAVADGQAAWLPEPGRFKVKVLSADAPEAALDVALACSAGTPAAWTLVEAAGLDGAAESPAPKGVPKPGRRRAPRAVADAVAEPVAGD